MKNSYIEKQLIARRSHTHQNKKRIVPNYLDRLPVSNNQNISEKKKWYIYISCSTTKYVNENPLF